MCRCPQIVQSYRRTNSVQDQIWFCERWFHVSAVLEHTTIISPMIGSKAPLSPYPSLQHCCLTALLLMQWVIPTLFLYLLDCISCWRKDPRFTKVVLNSNLNLWPTCKLILFGLICKWNKCLSYYRKYEESPFLSWQPDCCALNGLYWQGKLEQFFVWICLLLFAN